MAFFFFALPASTSSAAPSPCALSSSSDHFIKAGVAVQALDEDISPEADKTILVESFSANVAQMEGKLVVLVADDERLYRDGVVLQLRKDGNRGIACTHSNRILASDPETAIDHGADALLPKTMSTVHLLQLLCQFPKRTRLPVFLASDGDFSLSDFNGDVDARPPKQPISPKHLHAAVEKSNNRKKSS